MFIYEVKFTEAELMRIKSCLIADKELRENANEGINGANLDMAIIAKLNALKIPTDIL